MATFPVKYLHSGMRGAPVKSGSGVGSIIALLKASLIDGFGQVTLTNLVVSSGVATATVNAGDSFEQHAVVLLDGASVSAINGEQRVATSASTTFTFATSAPDGTVTGVITCKYAHVGHWEQTYTDTNRAVFKSTHPEANGFLLRVDESADTQLARVVGYESMADMDSGTAPFPTAAQEPGGGRWWRSSSNNATPTEWLIISDGLYFYFCNAHIPGSIEPNYGYGVWGFGDAIPLVPGDGWCTILAVALSSSTSGTSSLARADPSSGARTFAPRRAGGSGGSIALGKRPYCGVQSGLSGAVSATASQWGAAASTLDGRLVMTPVFLYEDDGQAGASSPRMDQPGMLFLPYTNAAAVLANRQIIDGAGPYAGRKLMAVRVNDGNLNAPATGIVLFDITGPWR